MTRHELTRIFGNTEADSFTFDSTLLGAVTRVYGSDDLSPTNEADGQDYVLVDELRTTPHRLTLDGQHDSDLYEVRTTGSEGDRRSYVVNVLDTGTVGIDKLDMYGTEASADVFLLRRSTAIFGETSTRPAFVALLHDDVADARCAANADPACSRPSEVQRVNYDAGLDDVGGGVFVHGLGGNDTFASDDTSAPVRLDGDGGADTFQIGQLYGSKRDGDAVAANDRFQTVATTRGWLSNGISRPLIASGGDGDDVFGVYANKAPLTLQGNAGNDLFTVRAFALAETTGDCTDVNNATCQIVWRDEAGRRRDAEADRHAGAVRRQRRGLDRRRHGLRQDRRARDRVRRPPRRRRHRRLRRRPDRLLLDDRVARGRCDGGRRHDRRRRSRPAGSARA